MRRKLLLLCVAMLAIFLAGCGADVELHTSINPDQSGSQTLIIHVPADQLKEVKGGEPSLTETLQASAPPGGKFEKATSESGSVDYKLTYPFKNLDELKAISKTILGAEPKVTFSQAGSPFAKEIKFRDDTPVRQYFAWGEKAITEKNLVDSDKLSYLINMNTNKYLVKIPSDEKELSYTYGNLTRTNSIPLEEISVVTDLEKLTRTLTVRISKANFESLHAKEANPSVDGIEQYFKNNRGVTNVTVNTSDAGDKSYTVLISGGTSEDLKRNSLFFILNENLEVSIEKDSLFFPVNHVQNRGQLGSWGGTQGYAKGTATSINSKVIFSGSESNPQGDVLKDENGKKVSEITINGPELSYNFYYTQKTLTFWITLGIGILIGIGLLVFGLIFYRKNPEGLKQGLSSFIQSAKENAKAEPVYPSLDSSTPEPRFCWKCGKALDLDERFCRACGFNSENPMNEGSAA